jgi:hypothetical protein
MTDIIDEVKKHELIHAFISLFDIRSKNIFIDPKRIA